MTVMSLAALVPECAWDAQRLHLFVRDVKVLSVQESLIEGPRELAELLACCLCAARRAIGGSLSQAIGSPLE